MTETTTVSMPSELKQFADENDISPSKLLQESLREEMKNRGGQEEELRNKKAKLESIIETIERDLEEKNKQLKKVESELAEIEESKSEIPSRMTEVIESYHSEDITPEQASNRVDLNLAGDEVEACYNDCVDSRRFDGSLPSHIRKMVEAEGEDADQLVLEYSEKNHDRYVDAKEVVENNITGLERERIESWVQSNLDK